MHARRASMAATGPLTVIPAVTGVVGSDRWSDGTCACPSPVAPDVCWIIPAACRGKRRQQDDGALFLFRREKLVNPPKAGRQKEHHQRHCEGQDRQRPA